MGSSHSESLQPSPDRETDVLIDIFLPGWSPGLSFSDLSLIIGGGGAVPTVAVGRRIIKIGYFVRLSLRLCSGAQTMYVKTDWPTPGTNLRLTLLIL